MSTRHRTWLLWIAIGLVAFLIYENAQLRWYRDRRITYQANLLSNSLAHAHDYLHQALEAAEQGKHDLAADELFEAYVAMERAVVAENSFSLALERRGLFETRTGATGFQKPIWLSSQLLKANLRHVERKGWTADVLTPLHQVRQDLELLRDTLTPELLLKHPVWLQSEAESLTGRLHYE